MSPALRPPSPALTAWKRRHDHALEQVLAARAAVASLAELAAIAVDRKLHWTAAALHGVEALLREADAAFKAEVR